MRNRSENQIKLLMLRHGMTRSNIERRYLGQADEGLCREGIQALRDAKAAGAYPAVDELFVSPMKRCLETARLLYPAQTPILISDWKEIDFGAFEGKNYKQLQGDEGYQKWIDSGGKLPFPDGECREAFSARCVRGLEYMLDCLSGMGYTGREDITVGMVVHGGTIMALLSRYCAGEYFSYQTANGRGYDCHLIQDAERIRLEKLRQI